MKRIAAAALAIVISLSCTGCGIKQQERSEGQNADIEYNAVTLPDNKMAAVSSESAIEEIVTGTEDVASGVTTVEQECDDMIAAPCSGADCVGLHYRNAAQSFSEAGFQDIRLVECHAECFPEGTVVFVMIDGNDVFDKGEEFSKSAEVIICYGGAVQATASTTVTTTAAETEAVEAAGMGEQNSGNSVTVPEREETVGQLVWVPTKGGKKYHSSPSCSNMIDPMQVSVETAKANGYTACKRCY